MKKIAFAIISFILLQNMQAQKVQTILPVQPVLEGTAFQIQYVISNPSEVINVLPPDFDSLRLVSGPNHYKGIAIVNGKQQALNNITYTFVASKPGNYSIKGIDVTFKNNIHQKAGDVFIKVITAPQASYNTRSNYTDASLYAPHTKKNLQQLIKDNLFVKTEVNKTTVFEGEPVVATYTLYSRLQSSSQATKSPSLYGFS
ncbi:MAG TPA: BatD family protein, partial [Flavisolibacter sp.]|nr:BatD family protein [Flavisolibacter sp.]